MYLNVYINRPDTLRIWDTLFSVDNKLQYLLYISTSLVYHIKDQILENDFGDNISFYIII